MFITFCKIRNNLLSCQTLLHSRRMLSQKEQMLKIVEATITAVSPDKLVENAVKREGNRLIVGSKSYELCNNVNLVGFGKAVLGMVPSLEKLIGDHIVKGVVSVPTGLVENMKNTNKSHLVPQTDKIKIREGGTNNLPDEQSLAATKEIVEIVEKSKENDIIIALVSGGGSTLLSYPIPPLSIEDKRGIIKYFSFKGASIQELNTVRSELSRVKGGKLAAMAAPAQIVGLILSDIIGDPIELIASGPTVPRNNINGKYYSVDDILQKFNDGSNQKVYDLIQSARTSQMDQISKLSNTYNVIIGSNSIALNAGLQQAKKLGLQPVVLGNDVTGEAREVGSFYAEMFKALHTGNDAIEKLQNASAPENVKFLDKLPKRVPDQNSIFNVCLLAGGEPTVNVNGSGVGGRNLEVVLGFAICMFENKFENVRWSFCSFGTDGQDGPTPVAGAFVSSDFPIIKSIEDLASVTRELKCNNSFGYLNQYRPENLITTGPTCTNVMDVHVLIIDHKKCDEESPIISL